jgi:hypothetical protein
MFDLVAEAFAGAGIPECRLMSLVVSSVSFLGEKLDLQTGGGRQRAAR